MGFLAKIIAKNAMTDSAYAALRKELKKGKSWDQCRCIDFLVRPNGDIKKKGCLSRTRVIDMSEYLAYIQKVMGKMHLKERAIQKIGLDESQISEIEPILITYFDLRSDNAYVQSEETNVEGLYTHTSNLYTVLWIFFSSTQIYTYKYVFDSISDNVTESTRDFFYSDITCIKTNHEIEEMILRKRRGCGCFKAKYVHANREWDTLEIVVPGDSYSFTTRSTADIEQTIQAAKSMIREKKGL